MAGIAQSRWYQFSLRMLLVGMVVLCLGAAWVAIRLREAEANRDRLADIEYAIAKVEAFRGHAGRGTFRGPDYVRMRRPTWLEELFGDPGGADDPSDEIIVTFVSLFKTGATDADLECLKALNRLTRLGLSKTQVTDTGLEHLSGLTNLCALDLDETQITDAGLVHLTGLTHLVRLDLAGTRVTDKGLEHLKELSSLEELDLASTQVTDAGLEHLKELINIEMLDLGDTRVSDDAVADLRRALPNCNITH